MSILKSETKTFIMGLLNDQEKMLKDRLYNALYLGSNGAEEAKRLGVALRAKEEFDEFVEADVEEKK